MNYSKQSTRFIRSTRILRHKLRKTRTPTLTELKTDVRSGESREYSPSLKIRGFRRSYRCLDA